MRLLKSGDLSEEDIQKTVMEWINLHPKVSPFVLHIPNEGKRTPKFGKKLKALGMLVGVSDLFIAIPMVDFHGAWIELKSKNGKLTKEQKEFLENMNQMNYFTTVCYSVEEAIYIISWYLGIPVK